MAVALQLIGSMLEIVGIFLMANMYVRRLPKSAMLAVILDALRRGETAKDAVAISEILPENKLISLQGLALIGFGFVIQAFGVVLSAFSSGHSLTN